MGGIESNMTSVNLRENEDTDTEERRPCEDTGRHLQAKKKGLRESTLLTPHSLSSSLQDHEK